MFKEARDRGNCVNKYFFSSARKAFFYLLTCLNLKRDEFILMPSYIGQSIKEGSGVFDPIRELGVSYLFYKLYDDLSVDVDDVEAVIRRGKIKALLVIHYFGFPQLQIEKIAHLCQRYGVVLIEDCAHSLNSEIKGKNIGCFGDYAIYSIHKIVSTVAGGVLQDNKTQNFISRNKICEDINLQDLLQYAKSDLNEIAQKRRMNFLYYLKRFPKTKFFEVYIKDLPEGVVPLNFPVIVKELNRYAVYNKLLEDKIPAVSLWYKLIDEIDTSIFVNTKKISDTILNLPIHQDITTQDIDAVLQALQTISIPRKLLILGGKPAGTLDIVNYAKSKNIHTIVCDYLPKNQSLAKQVADECWHYSTADIENIVSQIKKENVNAVFTGIHEFNLKQCVAICEKINCPCYLSMVCLDNVSDKKFYKDVFNQFGISLIKEYRFLENNISDNNIDYPILIKPVDGTGAYGLQICYSMPEVAQKLPKVLEYSAKKEVIIEQYIQEKEEITIVYIIKDGIPYLGSVADRLVEYADEGVIPLPVGYEWPSKYLFLYEKDVDSKMKQAIQYMGLQNGMLFIQAIVKDNVIMPYDIGFRLSGTQEHVILEEMCGYNPLKLLTDFALCGQFGDETLIEKINPHFKEVAAQMTFLIVPDTIGCFEGIDEVEKLEGVIRVIKNKVEGETVPDSARGTLNQVALRVFLKASDRKHLNKLKSIVSSKIKIKNLFGDNILVGK